MIEDEVESKVSCIRAARRSSVHGRMACVGPPLPWDIGPPTLYVDHTDQKFSAAAADLTLLLLLLLLLALHYYDWLLAGSRAFKAKSSTDLF